MAKYALGVNTDFAAKHYLVGGDFGPEGEPHSHDYRVEVVLEGDRLDEHGFLVDIVRVKAELGELVDRYRDNMLNDLPEFAGASTGCEAFSRVVAEALSERLGLAGISRLRVRIWENAEAWAETRLDLASNNDAE